MNFEKPANKRKWAIVAVSRDGTRTALRAARYLTDQRTTVYTLEKFAAEGTEVIPGKLTDFWPVLMEKNDVLLCVMASGIVVRGIAPYLGHKSADPAVLVMDSAGKFIISLLSGHLGGANEAAAMLACRMDATPVITTATDVKGSMAVDVLAQKTGCALIDFEGAKDVTALILDDKPVAVLNHAGINVDGIVLPSNLIVDGDMSKAAGVIVITDRTSLEGMDIPDNLPAVTLIPKTLSLGIGCKKNTDGGKIIAKVKAFCEAYGRYPEAIAFMGTIGLKAHEQGIIDACEAFGAKLKVVDDMMIKMVQGRFDGSDFVEKTTGLRAVSEPAGYVVSGFGRCVAPVKREDGVTLSLWENAT